MQNHLSGSGYLLTLDISCAFGLIFAHGLLPLVSLGLSHFQFCFISTEYSFFYFPV